MKKILLIVSLLAASAGVNAATIGGSSSGVFVNPQGPGVPNHIEGVGTNSISWGDGAVIGKSCFFFWCKTVSSDPSSLTFQGKDSFSGDVGDNVTIGKMKFENGTIYAGSEASSVDFALTLDFTTPFSEVTTFIYNFALENTINPNGDSVLLLNAGNPLKFYTYEGQDYFFSLLGFQLGNTLTTEMFAKELKQQTLKLVGVFTTSEVPLPAAVWLFLSGLMGFMAIRRRAKAQ